MKRQFFTLLAGLLCLSGSVAQAAKVDTLSVHSNAMNKNVTVLTVRPDKAVGGEKCPVIYLLHGHGGNAFTWMTIKPDLPQIADREGIIFVCPDGKNSWYWDSPRNKNYRYEIISAYTTGVNSDTYTLFKGPGEEFEEYLKKIKSYSDIKTEDTELTIKDKIVTLSTCTGNESTRFVVQGKRVNAEDDGSGENAGSANSDAASVDSVTVQEG